MSGSEDDQDPQNKTNGKSGNQDPGKTSAAAPDHAHGEIHGHEHDHHHAEDDEAAALADADLTAAIEQAQSGLRSDVRDLLAHLESGFLFIPLAEDIPNVVEGEEMELEGDLSFRPHMLVHEDGSVYACAFSETELVETVATNLGWQTSGDDLKFVHLPALIAFELGQAQFDGQSVSGLVLNPGTEAELLLSREEAASLAQGNAIPLVGYVEDLPDDDEQTQVIEGADPAPAALLQVLEASKAKLKHLLDFEVKTTFNPERDREPHLTIVLTVVGGEQERAALADEVMQNALPHLPPPGYADIVFRDAPN